MARRRQDDRTTDADPAEPPAEQRQRRVATVACDVPNGLTLQLVAEGPDDGTGRRPLVRVGEKFVIGGPPPVPGAQATVLTAIDAEFLALWLEQNKLHPAVVGGMVREAT